MQDRLGLLLRICIIVLVLFSSAKCHQEIGQLLRDVRSTSVAPPSGSQIWAKTINAGTGAARFNAVATDDNGNIYAVGTQNGTDAFEYGPGVTAQGQTAFVEHPVIVKYDRFGSALWARTTVAGTVGADAGYWAVAADASGNVYAAGYRSGNAATLLSSTPLVSIPAAYVGSSILVVKYDSSGNVQWARSVASASLDSEFKGVVVVSGRVYAAGYMMKHVTTAFDFGNGFSLNSGVTNQKNSLIIRYNADTGDTEGASGITSATLRSEFLSISTDIVNNRLVVAGYQRGDQPFNYGGAVTALTSCATNCSEHNATIVSYDFALGAQCGSTVVNVSSPFGISEFKSVSADSSGNIYAAGRQQNNFTWGYNAAPLINATAAAASAYNYGSAAATIAGFNSTDHNIVLVKYDSTGNAISAKTTLSGGSHNAYSAITVDSLDGVIAVGKKNTSNAISIISGSTLAGTATAADNPIIVRYLSASF